MAIDLDIARFQDRLACPPLNLEAPVGHDAVSEQYFRPRERSEITRRADACRRGPNEKTPVTTSLTLVAEPQGR
jgi:hypothetical protein